MRISQVSFGNIYQVVGTEKHIDQMERMVNNPINFSRPAIQLKNCFQDRLKNDGYKVKIYYINGSYFFVSGKDIPRVNKILAASEYNQKHGIIESSSESLDKLFSYGGIVNGLITIGDYKNGDQIKTISVREYE